MKVFAAMLPVCAWLALALVALAHGSSAGSGEGMHSVLSSVGTYCAHLEQRISAERFHFSGWRCSQGPTMRGYETILAWVKLTRPDGAAHVELIWLVETEPVENAQVIDAMIVPGYGYQPSDVREAFKAPRVDYLSA